MSFIYGIAMRGYYIVILIASLFNEKARKWIVGRRGVFSSLEKTFRKGDRVIWFHCASLGEFEQGRPLMEKIKEEHPDLKLFITFFSPSGYEIRKDYEKADYVFYLPLDTKRNAYRFVNLVQPEKVFFIKYELWRHYLEALNSKNVPTYLVSALFRRNQFFFKWYGQTFLKTLKLFNGIFVQNIPSQLLLGEYKISSEISGDTRFDRVHKVVGVTKKIPLADLFSSECKVVVAGSSWPEEERLIANIYKDISNNSKLMIAPHNIDETHIKSIVKLFEGVNAKVLLFSQAKAESIKECDVLVVDSIGLLSSLYKYADIAIVGGGFSGNLHNILEPATFGLPVLFGPNFSKFPEAKMLLDEKGAFVFKDEKQLKYELNRYLTNDDEIKFTNEINSGFIKKNIGATNFIYEKTFS